MAHIALHALHQIGDEIGAAFELHLDAAPTLMRHLPFGHQPVEDDDDEQREGCQKPDQGPEHKSPPRARHSGAARFPMF
jgi:hypothetical protein